MIMTTAAWVLIGAVAAVALTAFWDELRTWASTRLARTVGELLGPDARELLLDLLVAADDAISAVKRAGRALWARVQDLLLKATVAVEQRTDNRTVRTLTAWLKKRVNGEERVYRVVYEEEVPWEDLPAEVRERFIHGREQRVAHLHLPAVQLH